MILQVELMSSSMFLLIDYIEKVIAELHDKIKGRYYPKYLRPVVEKLEAFSSCLKSELPEEFVEKNFAKFDQHFGFVKYYLNKKDLEMLESNFEDIRKRDFPKIKSKIIRQIDKLKTSETEKGGKSNLPLFKNVFIVHGRDHAPVKELKEMLQDFGLNPIVLHEKTSEGSATLAEKLEEHSKDVEYAFIILTPDDVGGHREDMRKILGAKKPFLQKDLGLIENRADQILDRFEPRARQNVIFEMGYFWGLLQRKRVCCLLKGDVEKPSDINGVVYVGFKNSVKEAEDKILTKLRKAGYEIKL